jgi:hypothetical protein
MMPETMPTLLAIGLIAVAFLIGFALGAHGGFEERNRLHDELERKSKEQP